ncbi:MAG: S8 family peptidase [Bdellovibrionales bacterium]
MAVPTLILVLATLFSQTSFAQVSPYLVQYRKTLDFHTQLAQTKGLQLRRLLQEQTRLREVEVLGAQSQQAETLWIAYGSLLKLTPQEASRLRQNFQVERLTSLNHRVRLMIPRREAEVLQQVRYTYGLQKIKIPEVRSRFWGLDGRGIRVGVIDTGIDPRHPALQDRTVAYRDFTTKPISQIRDDHGHGSHVAGTVGARDVNGRSVGVAPGVDFVIAKVFNSRGSAEEAELLKALQWMADPDGNADTDDGAHVVNNSWNNDKDFSKMDPEEEPFCQVVSELKKLGTISVFAAGNDGPETGSIKLPAACPDSLTVASTDRDDRVATSSSRGPVQWKSRKILKPDVAAPGVSIDSVAAGGGYTTKSGTSMAAPHVAGALALVLQRYGNLTPDQAVETLVFGAQDLGAAGPDIQFGAGRIDLLKALEQP